MGNVHSTNQTAVWSWWKPVFNTEKMRYLISGYNTKSYLYRITSFLPYDFFMPFHLFILNFQQILFLKVKSTQLTQLFLAMLDRFIKLFHELFIEPRNNLGIPMIFEDNDSFSHFCCATANPGSSKSLTGLSREDRNEPLCFALCSRAENIVKISKAYYNEDKIFCCRGFLILLLFPLSLLPDISLGFFVFFGLKIKPQVPQQTKGPQSRGRNSREEIAADCAGKILHPTY